MEAYIELADAIEAAFPSVVVEGNEEGDGRAGAFEVSTSDGHQVHSRLQGQKLPDPEDLIQTIANRARLSKEQPTDGPTCG